MDDGLSFEGRVVFDGRKDEGWVSFFVYESGRGCNVEVVGWKRRGLGAGFHWWWLAAVPCCFLGGGEGVTLGGLYQYGGVCSPPIASSFTLGLGMERPFICITLARMSFLSI